MRTGNTVAAEQNPERHQERSVSIDYLKAVAIVGVVAIHALRGRFDADHSEFEFTVKIFFAFAVPCFLFASGYLYAAREHSGSVLWRRFARILVPYLIASLVMETWWLFEGRESTLPQVARNFLLGGSFGIYYYVFILVLFVMMLPLMEKLTHEQLWLLYLISLAGLLFLTGPHITPGFFWAVRNPANWLHVFILGRLFFLERDRFTRMLSEHRTAIVLLTLAVYGATAWCYGLDLVPRRFLFWIVSYSTILVTVTLTHTAVRVPKMIWFLSAASYSIYLYHYQFLLMTRAVVGPPPGLFELWPTFVTWCGGLIGATLLVLLIRALFGRHSRWLIGA